MLLFSGGVLVSGPNSARLMESPGTGIGLAMVKILGVESELSCSKSFSSLLPNRPAERGSGQIEQPVVPRE